MFCWFALYDRGPFYAERKFDGERLLVHVFKGKGREPAAVKLFSRRGTDYSALYGGAAGEEGVSLLQPSLSRAILEALQGEAAVIDGEVLAVDGTFGQAGQALPPHWIKCVNV